ncbi:c-type cytochrome [Sphingomonas sp. ID0503]|uniref:c-type cytochrome n=1 Tax=Sphingomonas sp. ID0503 TaxID=3399691 RepID=UPI003AFB5015
MRGIFGAVAGAVALLGATAGGAAARGAAVFANNCAACHQANGKGIPGAFPALAGDKFVTGDPRAVALTLLNGRGGMPAFAEVLKDDELAAVANYIRSTWGNKAAPVPPALFAAGRKGGKAILSRPIPAH